LDWVDPDLVADFDLDCVVRSSVFAVFFANFVVDVIFLAGSFFTGVFTDVFADVFTDVFADVFTGVFADIFVGSSFVADGVYLPGISSIIGVITASAQRFSS